MSIFSAKGALLQMSDGTSPGVFTTIGQVKSIAGPTTKSTIQDVTTHSTVGNFHQKLATLVDPGDLTFPINYDAADTTHQFITGLWELMVQLTDRAFKLVFAHAAGTMKFNGFVSQHAFAVPVDNVLGCNIQITISGTGGAGSIVVSNP